MKTILVTAISCVVLAACTRNDGTSVVTDATAAVGYYTIGAMARSSPPKVRSSAPAAPDIDGRFAPYARTIDGYAEILESDNAIGWLDNERLLVNVGFNENSHPVCNRVSKKSRRGVCVAIWKVGDRHLDFNVRVDEAEEGVNRGKSFLVLGVAPDTHTVPMVWTGTMPRPTPENRANPTFRYEGKSYRIYGTAATTAVGVLVVASVGKDKDVFSYFLNRNGSWLPISTRYGAADTVTPSPDGCKFSTAYRRTHLEFPRVLVVDLCAALGAGKAS